MWSGSFFYYLYVFFFYLFFKSSYLLLPPSYIIEYERIIVEVQNCGGCSFNFFPRRDWWYTLDKECSVHHRRTLVRSETWGLISSWNPSLPLKRASLPPFPTRSSPTPPPFQVYGHIFSGLWEENNIFQLRVFTAQHEMVDPGVTILRYTFYPWYKQNNCFHGVENVWVNEHRGMYYLPQVLNYIYISLK